jgi:hypothetical protein
VLRLAGYLLQSTADQVRALCKADQAVLVLHFEH